MTAPDLEQIQRRFRDGLLADTPVDTSLPLRQQSPDNATRLAIYRNNVRYSLGSALADLYPVLMRLTGEEYFRALARAYLSAHPPRQTAMVLYGRELPDFLKSFPPTRDYPWLADVAALELAWQEACHADDLAPLTAADLTALAPADLARSRLALHPSLRRLSSNWPILTIWETNQADVEDPAEVDLDAGGDRVCVSRPGLDVRCHRLDAGGWAFLESLALGHTLDAAIRSGLDADPAFAPEQALATGLTEGWFAQLVSD